MEAKRVISPFKPKKKPAKRTDKATLTLVEDCVNTVCQTASSVVDVVDGLCETYEKTPKIAKVAQQLLDAMEELNNAADIIATAKKRFEGMAKLVHEKGGAFEVGRIAITFPVTTSRRPKWKDEAVKVAGALAKARGKNFDGEKFVTTVQGTYPALTSVSVKLIRSNG